MSCVEAQNTVSITFVWTKSVEEIKPSRHRLEGLIMWSSREADRFTGPVLIDQLSPNKVIGQRRTVCQTP